MTQDESLRNHLVAVLKAGQSHSPIDPAVAAWPAELRGSIPGEGNHSAWQLLEHLRIAQSDILGFSVSRDHVSPVHPDGYWPDSESPPDDGAWDRSIRQFGNDLNAMQALVGDPHTDLYARIPHGDGQTILKEALTLASHNSYHIGQLMTLRKVLGVEVGR